MHSTQTPVSTPSTLVPGSSRPVAFVDAELKDYRLLSHGLQPGIDVTILDPRWDGIHQITAVLTQRSHVPAVHIIAPGAPGCLKLGNTYLSIRSLKRYAAALASWRSALQAGADVLIYAGEFAADPLCPIFPSNLLLGWLHRFTGANVAATATPIGNAKLGGNWNLEVRVGLVKTPLALTEELRDAYKGLLSLPLTNP